jgi:hypothetical protein
LFEVMGVGGEIVALDGGTVTVAKPDHSPPVIRMGSMSPLSLSASGGLVTLQVTATDNVAVASVAATISKPDGSTTVINLLPGPGNIWSGGYNVPPNGTGKAQTYRAAARATDTSGNRSAVFNLGRIIVAR